MNATNNTINNNNMNTSTTATRSIKINFQGASRDVEVAADQATLAGLQAAIASAFEADLPPRPGDNEAPKDSDLRFTYKDPDGDSIVFDKDWELSLALRLCPISLEISAAGKEKVKPANKHDREHRLYKVAARNLREYNGVPSMTPTKLTKTLAFLKLNPRRLVNQGLAPQVLLADMKDKNDKSNQNTAAATQQHPLGDDDCNEDLAESVAAGVEAMRVEEDKKEWNDGFVPVDPAQSAAPAAPTATAVAAAAPAETSTSDADADHGTAAPTGDDDDTDTDADEAAKGKRPVDRPVHKAFVAGGIMLLPREVWPLLVALGVGPRRLVKLGHVNVKHLGAMAVAHKKANNKKLRMTRGSAGAAWRPWGPCGPDGRSMQRGPCGAGGGACRRRGAGASGGKPRGPGMAMRGHPYSSFTCLPPPPPPHTEEEDGMFFSHAPPAGGGGGGFGGCPGGRHGGRRGPHAHSHPHGPHYGPHHGAHHGVHHGVHRGPHPPHPHPHPHPHGFEGGEGGSGFHQPISPRAAREDEDASGSSWRVTAPARPRAARDDEDVSASSRRAPAPSWRAPAPARLLLLGGVTGAAPTTGARKPTNKRIAGMHVHQRCEGGGGSNVFGRVEEGRAARLPGLRAYLAGLDQHVTHE
ncbi:unnamed protein product [Pylaiella littoralis]